MRCEVEVGGALSSHKGMNIPGADAELPAPATDGDLGWVEFAVEHGVDLLAVSFVSHAPPTSSRSPSACAELGSDIPLIAKIEKPQAAENAEEIVAAATGGIMVARGDLGIELPLAEVPVSPEAADPSRRPALEAVDHRDPDAGLDGHAPRPTRAEVTDVANAIYDGTDAVMLSEETAVGQHPIEAVRVMDQIARATEPDLPYGEWLFTRTDQATQDVADSVAQGAVGAVYRLGLAALVVPTSSGRTARLVSAHRPNVPVLAVSPRIETVRRLSLLFGVTAVLSERQTEVRGLLDDCAALAARARHRRSGDLIAITAGLPEQELGTNLFEVHRVPVAGARGQHELADDQVRDQLPGPRHPHLDDDRAAADVQRHGLGVDLLAETAGAEDVELELDRGEVGALRQVAEGDPGGDRVAERGPDAAVDELAGVQVALVDDDPAGRLLG